MTMHWIAFAILSYAAVLLQTTAVHLLKVPLGRVGLVTPDLLAMVALFVCLTARGVADAMLAAWVLGALVDLTSAGSGAGPVTVVGPMAFAYAVAAAAVFRIREAFFRERISTRVLLGAAFCFMAHGMWLTAQSLLMVRHMTWEVYGSMVLLAAAAAVYTGILTPICFFGLSKIERRLILTGGLRSRR